MTPDAWMTLAVVLLLLLALWRELATPLVLVFGALAMLLLLGVVDPVDALVGFSNPAPFIVGALFVVAAAVGKTGALDALTSRLLGTAGHNRRPMLRLLAPVAISSAVIANTPVVAMMIPQITSWARRMRRNASVFLMPLSFVALLGGTITIIGTSTNLVIAGQMDDAGLEPLGFFETARIGIPITLVGILVIVYLAPRALKGRTPAGAAVDEEANQYMVEFEVTPGGSIDGRTVQDAGLRHLDGLFLASVRRADTVIAPATPTTVLRGGNRLQFVGQLDRVLDLRQRDGLAFIEIDHPLDLHNPNVAFFTAVVGGESPLVGYNLRDIGFRSRYQAAVVTVRRDGVNLGGKLGEIDLRVGDTLVLVSDTGFRERWASRTDFLLVDKVDEQRPTRSPGAVKTLVVVALFIAVSATGVMELLHASIAAALLLVVLGVLTPDEARRAVDIEVVGVIASAFGIAAAMSSTGLDTVIANGVIDIFDDLGPTWILFGMTLLTVLLTELVTNNAAALLMFPIAVGAASAVGVDPRGMAISVAVAASASFLTPIGYQTNTMVYGPGGYRFSDYARLGAPLTLLVIAAIVIIVPIAYSV